MRPLFLLPAVFVLLLPKLAIAQSLRYPTETELADLIQTFRLRIPQLMQTGYYTDRRTADERQQREAQVAAWAEVDGAIAPFLGEWMALEESLAIFPAQNPGEVCVIDSALEESDFYRGSIVDDKVYTDVGLVFVLDSGFLGSTFVTNNGAGLYEYANPLPMSDPSTSQYYQQYQPAMIERFQAAGCRIEIAAKGVAEQ